MNLRLRMEGVLSRKKQRLLKIFLEVLLTVSCRCDCQVPDLSWPERAR